jgi:RNA polymerase sigma factor (sigma-70 family)
MAVIDPHELGRLFDAHGSALVLYARQWLELGLSEDVVQDVFVALAAQPRVPTQPRAWLFRSVRNATLNRLRSRRRRRQHEAEAATARPEWFEARPENLIDAAAAQAAVATLASVEREIVVLRVWGGLTLHEIAEILGQPVSTLWSRYHDALTALRQKLVTSCRTKTT